jgi:hypothetical protein
MKTEGLIGVRRRRSQAEGTRLVSEFKQSGLGRKEFCAARGLNVHTLDAWRKRVEQSECREEIVPVEIVERSAGHRDSRPAASAALNGQFRVVLADGLRIEVEAGFDASELRRLVKALDGDGVRGCLSRPV